MLKKLEYKLVEYPYITQPLEDESVFQKMIIPDFFDRIGYELTYTEGEFHKQSHIPGHILVPGRPTDASACFQDWMYQEKYHPHIFLDHCHLNTRYGYAGEALEQLKEQAKHNKRLYKLINIKPKYMADFCIDWIEDGKVFELMHIEHDFHDFELYKQHVAFLEDLILSQDWEKVYDDLKPLISEDSYDEYEQSKTKAKYFGIDHLEYLHEPKMLSFLKVY
jgi:hypothetical protein